MSFITENPFCRLECESGLLRDMSELATENDVMVYAPLFDTGTKHDATGAFHPGARRFCIVQGLDPASVWRWDNRIGRWAQADLFVTEVERRMPKILVGFHHGYQHGIQPGLRSPGHPRFSDMDKSYWDRFCAALSARSWRGFACPVVVLYACSTGDDPDGDPDTAPGSGDGSFADLLRDELCARQATQCRVVAHTTAGHSWYNRDLKFFDGVGSESGGIGAELLAIDGDDDDDTATHERRMLSHLLGTDWAFTMPFRSVPSIRQDLL